MIFLVKISSSVCAAKDQTDHYDKVLQFQYCIIDCTLRYLRYFWRSIQSVQTASDVYAAFCSPTLLGFSSPLFWLLFSSRPQALKRYFVAVFCRSISSQTSLAGKQLLKNLEDMLLQNTATKYLFRACGLELNNNQNSGDEKPRRVGEQNAAYTSEAV
jgi:hypothetical protein